MTEWLDIIKSGNRLFGVNIIPSTAIPASKQKIELSSSVMVTPKFRTEFNEWLKERFGEEIIIYQSPQGIITHPKNVALLKWLSNENTRTTKTE